jgi:hypothetical protein
MGIVQRIVGVVLGLLFLVAVFVFASIILGALIAIGIAIWAWVWWRTRSLRKARGGAVIEGEFRDATPPPRLDKRDPP